VAVTTKPAALTSGAEEQAFDLSVKKTIVDYFRKENLQN
jgi:hypothetical protein